MKKLILSIGLLATSFINAQENWLNMEQKGFTHGATFRFTQPFLNKLYVAGDTSNSPLLYSTLTGDTGSYVEESAFKSVLQSYNETQLSSSAANNSYMFLGTVAYFDSLSDHAIPQVYRYDGTNYVKHGTINFNLPNTSTGYYNCVNRMALYSPTGSNDTIYAFSYLGQQNTISVWKAAAGATNPTWIKSSDFSTSGITNVYDAKVWHKKLYIAVDNSVNGGMILRTANGIDWDTVVTAMSLQNKLGQTWPSARFKSFEIFNDTLVSSLTGGGIHQELWYTADSLAPTQTWKSLIDSAKYAGISDYWYDVVDLQVGDGKLWMQVNYSNQYPEVYICTKNAAGRDTLLHSSAATGLESYQNYYSGYTMSYFKNAIYSSGYFFMGSKIGNPQGRKSGNNPAATGGNPGNIWRFTTIKPTISFVDSVAPGTGYCVNNSIYLNLTTTNAYSISGTQNGNSLSFDGTPYYYYPSTNQTDTIILTAYNGTSQSIYNASSTVLILIHPNPVIDTVSATSYTVCQGQPDTLKTKVHGGTAPYTYTWNNVQDNLSYTGDSAMVIQLYVVPTPSPYVYNYVTVKDANSCFGSGNNTTLYLYVNKGDSLSGTISDTLLNPISAGQVYLFQKKANHVGVADSAGVMGINANGKYYFPSLYYGDYYLKAVADTNILAYRTSVGTYYSNKQNAYQWDSALVIQQHTCGGGNNSGKDITIIQIPAAPAGPGTITGVVSEGPGFGQRYINHGGYAPMGAPLKGVDIKLGKNPGGNAAARTTTDTSGNYTFHNVPLGNYKIYVDIPNYGMDSVRGVNLSSGSPLSVHNDYFVDSSMVRVVPTYVATAAICAGDSIKLQGVFQHAAGVYYDTLTAPAGYDSLIVTNLSITPIPTLTVTANTYTVCSGTQAILTASGTTSFGWSSNAGSVTTATASVNPIANTTYTVTGTSNSCSISKTVSINTLNLPNITASASVDSVCLGGSVTLVAGGATTYTWSNGVTNWVSFVPGATNTYTVTATGANTCVNTATVTVIVKTCIGIRQISAAGLLNVYPIPATNSLFIEVEKNARIKIYDITGQLVLEQSVSQGKNEINISHLSSGAYDLTLNADGQITYVKVMISK